MSAEPTATTTGRTTNESTKYKPRAQLAVMFTTTGAIGLLGVLIAYLVTRHVAALVIGPAMLVMFVIGAILLVSERRKKHASRH